MGIQSTKELEIEKEVLQAQCDQLEGKKNDIPAQANMYDMLLQQKSKKLAEISTRFYFEQNELQKSQSHFKEPDEALKGIIIYENEKQVEKINDTIEKIQQQMENNVFDQLSENNHNIKTKLNELIIKEQKLKNEFEEISESEKELKDRIFEILQSSKEVELMLLAKEDQIKETEAKMSGLDKKSNLMSPEDMNHLKKVINSVQVCYLIGINFKI